jgi:MoaA/NifB/PqqE/SkfB family radical SAM enzyme
VITAYGDVRPCSCAPFTFGNVRHEGIGDIYERICSTEPYNRVSLRCRVLDPVYRAKYIDSVDSSMTFPVPFPGLKERLPGTR